MEMGIVVTHPDWKITSSGFLQPVTRSYVIEQREVGHS